MKCSYCNKITPVLIDCSTLPEWDGMTPCPVCTDCYKEFEGVSEDACYHKED